MALVYVAGNSAAIVPIASGLDGSVGVTVIGSTAYAIEGKIGYMFDPKLKDKSPDPFTIRAIRAAGGPMRALAVLAALALLVPVPALADANCGNRRADRCGSKSSKACAQSRSCSARSAIYVDRGLWGEAADLFTDDGTIEIGLDGVYVGKARIREYLKRLHGGQEGLIYGQLNEWVTLQPAIDVSTPTAAAPRRAGATSACSASTRSTPNGATGSTRTRYVKGADGIWQIKSLHLYVNFVAPYDKGWARLKPGEGLARSQAERRLPARPAVDASPTSRSRTPSCRRSRRRIR